MRLLGDENLPASLITQLRVLGHDVLWVREECPGSDDEHVLDIAVAEGRILVTQDKAFASLVSRQVDTPAPGIILLRLDGLRRNELVQAALSAIVSRPDWTGKSAVVGRQSIRIKDLQK